MVNQKYKLLTADLSQVCDDRSTSTVDEFVSASVKKSRTDVREENNDNSVITKMFEDSSTAAAENRDPISSQRRPAVTKRYNSSDAVSKLNTSRTSPLKSKLLTADLSQVCCDSDRSMADDFEFASPYVNEAHADVRDDNSTANDILKASNASSMFEVDSAAENRDPISSPGMKRGKSSDFASKLNTSRTSPTKPGYLYRKRSQPHHKSPSKNQALSSIMKSPKYSASNTGSFDSSATKPPRVRHNSMSAAMSSTLSPLTSKPRRKYVDQWIASGVVFNSSVEVYLFTSD